MVFFSAVDLSPQIARGFHLLTLQFWHVRMKTLKPGSHWRQSRLFPKLVTNRQLSRLSPIRRIVNCLIAPPRNILTYLLTYLQHLEFDHLSRSMLSPTRLTLFPMRSTLSPVCTGLYSEIREEHSRGII